MSHPKYRIFILTILIFAPELAFGQRSIEGINKDEAVKVAEQFVKDNGYCSLPPDKGKLQYELYDGYLGGDDSVLKHRRNSLQCHAFCFREDSLKWNIGFLSSKVTKMPNVVSDLPGRAVIISKDGKEVRMAHKSPLFSKFRKL